MLKNVKILKKIRNFSIKIIRFSYYNNNEEKREKKKIMEQNLNNKISLTRNFNENKSQIILNFLSFNEIVMK